MRNIYKATAIIGLFINLIMAQTVNIRGTVKDAANGSPLAGANVIVIGTSIGTATDTDGKYEIPNLNAGDYILKAAYIGYLEQIDSLSIEGDKDIEKDFSLSYTTIEGQEVVVTGQAKGQMDAINRQLNAKSIMNIVSSDRIRELPDANVAETIARVPGVTIKRDGGEGNKVIIRGLSPKYNSITVDGTRLSSTDYGDRSTDLSMISQYMLDGIEVTKAGTPDLDADVLGGTVNLKLKRAEAGGLNLNILAQGMHNGLEETSDDRKFVFELGNRFWDDRIGVLYQIDNENRNRSSHALGTNYDNPGATTDSITPVVLNGLLLSDMARFNDRENSLLVLDINISNGNISYTNLDSKIEKDIEGTHQWYSTYDNAKWLWAARAKNNLRVNTQNLKYNQTFFSKLHFDMFSSFSKSTNDSTTHAFGFNERYAFPDESYNLNIYQMQEAGDQEDDVARTGLDRYNYNRVGSSEEENSFGFNLKYDFRIGSQISANIKFGNKIRKKSRSFDRTNEYAPVAAGVGLTEPRDAAINEFPRLAADNPEGTRLFALTSFVDPDYDAGNFLDGQFTSNTGIDLDFAIDLYNYFRNNWTRYSPGASVNNEMIMHRLHETNSVLYDYAGDEEYSAYYAMLDMDIGTKLNIITGARIEKNITEYQSYRGAETALPHWVTTVESYTDKRENEFVLPALFLKYEPYEWLDVRFASTNTLTRPNYSDIIPLLYTYSQSRQVDFRNTFLEPGKSENLDFSVAVNDNRLGFFSVGYFQKNIEDLIYSSGRRYIDDPEKYGVPENTHKWAISDYRANNEYAVKLSGIEIDYQTRFWYLPGLLKGLVLNANYTTIDSEVKYPRTIVDIAIDWGPPLTTVTTNIDTFYVDRLLDQSDEVINLSIGYDYKGFSGRISMLQKANTFTRTNFWPALRESSDDYTRWDLSIKQKLPVEGLAMYLNISNLTDEIDRTLVRGGNFPAFEEHYGKTIDLGFRYSF